MTGKAEFDSDKHWDDVVASESGHWTEIAPEFMVDVTGNFVVHKGRNFVAQDAAPEDTSDGHHTFRELYDYRLLYNAAIFNEWAIFDQIDGLETFDVHKSRRHSDGELCFGGGWFVVVAELPTGQISNHYREKDWDLFRIPERETAAEWDGHTPEDVARRLRAFLTAPEGR